MKPRRLVSDEVKSINCSLFCNKISLYYNLKPMHIQNSRNLMNSVSSDSNNESILSHDYAMKKRKQKIKIVLVGASDVGKTAIA